MSIARTPIAAALGGRTLRSLSVASDSSHVTAHLDDGEVEIWARGDCCAHAYIESLNITGSMPAIITDWVEKGYTDGVEGSGPYGEYQDVGFYEIRTSTGFIQIELRVDHNGYYGGWLSLRRPN